MANEDIWTYDPIGEDRMPLPRRILTAQMLDMLGEIKEMKPGLDAANAERLFLMWRQKLRYCAERRKWLIFWDGAGIWRWDDIGVARKMAEETLYQTYRLARAKENETVRKQMHKSMDTIHRYDAMLRAAEPELGIRLDQIDQNHDLLAFQNGVLNLATGDFKTKPSPEDFITKRLEYKYEPLAEKPMFQAFLSRALGWHKAISSSEAEQMRQMLNAVQLYLGYCLTGRTSSKTVFLWHGPKNSGKTTLLNTVLRLMGSYGAQIQVESLLKQGGGISNSTNADLADLLGARFALTSEMSSGQRLDAARFKALTKGDGKIKARRLGENPILFAETHKLNIDTNDLPVVPEDDEALWQRFVPIPFNVSIPEAEQDRGLPEKLMKEAEGILAWMVEGARRWYELDGKLDRPGPVREAAAAYRGAMDVVKQFVDDCCEQCPGDRKIRVGSTVLYRAFDHWREQRRIKPLSHMAFSLKMKALGFEGGHEEEGAVFYCLHLLLLS